MAGITTLTEATLLAGAATLPGLSAADRLNPAHGNVPLKGIGVRTASDEVAEHGTDVYRHRLTTPICVAGLDREPDVFGGAAIYGGVMGPQFGHVVSQSVGRLWTAERLEPDLPILFLNANPGFDRLPDYFVDLVRVLGIANPIHLVTAPTRVATLHLGPDLCNLERRPTADPQFLDWLWRHQPVVQVDQHLQLYISRSRMGPRAGQYLQEVRLEEALAAEGYRIIHPETLSISQQIAMYQRARRLIFADGSALHLWSLFAAAEQDAAIILRRPWLRNFRFWFRSFNRAPVRVLDRIVANFLGTGAAGRQPVALLDMEALWQDLGDAGFHSGTRQLAGAEAWLGRGAAEPFDWDPASAALLAMRPLLVRTGAA